VPLHSSWIAYARTERDGPRSRKSRADWEVAQRRLAIIEAFRAGGSQRSVVARFGVETV